MGVRVVEGEQPGYAIFLFDKPIDAPTLQLAVRSLQVGQGAFIGMGGSWVKTPKYFSTPRVPTDTGEFGYRVGPEVVNHLLDLDQIEVRSDDGALCELGVWENAVPSMLPVGKAPAFISPEAASNPPPPRQREAAYSPPPPPPSEESSASSAGQPGPGAGEGTGDKSKLWIAVAGGAALLGLAAVIGFVPSLRCSLLHIGCPLQEAPEQIKAREARDCADKRVAASDFCSLDTACLAPYRSQFPNGAAIAEFGATAENARQRCARVDAEARALDEARKCAAAATPCVAQACYQNYLSAHGDSSRAAEARSELASAQRSCAPPPPPPQPQDTDRSPLPDNNYTAHAKAGCGAKSQWSVLVSVRGGRISWSHSAPLAENGRPVDVPWSGTIDRNGNITASFGGSSEYVATGRYTGDEREVTMRYPRCASPVIMTIGQPTGR